MAASSLPNSFDVYAAYHRILDNDHSVRIVKILLFFFHS
jgi:hypothetical protein